MKKVVKKRVIDNIPKYTFLGCPLTKNRSPWCFRICNPNADGQGRCGRVAPHTIKGRIQQGIVDFDKEKKNKK